MILIYLTHPHQLLDFTLLLFSYFSSVLRSLREIHETMIFLVSFVILNNRFLRWSVKMRRCCCCISVHAGSVILGIVAVVLAGLELAVLIPYLLGLEDFNPIGDNMDQAKKIIEESLKEQNGIGLNE